MALLSHFRFHKYGFVSSLIEQLHEVNYVYLKLLCFVVYGVDPDLTREGGSIPVTLTLQEATGKNVMLLPVGACDDGAHSQNEKIDRYNYIQGVG